MRIRNKYYPVAIGLTTDHGWQAIYEGDELLGVSFDKVFYFKPPSESLGIMIETCTNPFSTLSGGENMLVPEIFKRISKIEISFVSE